MPNCHYALCLTSCNRFDLLKQTLESFANSVNIKPRVTIICEDSDAEMPEFLRNDLHAWCSKLGPIRWLTNGMRRGQVVSIDRLIAAVPKDIERVFWLEDDWLCDRTLDLNEAFTILDSHSEICQVVLRNDWPHTLVNDPRFPFKIAQPFWRGQNWGGWAWNPNVTRISDLKRFGTYASQAGFVNGLKHEEVFSRKFLDAGFRIAALPDYFHHIGAGRSRSIEPLPPMPKVLIAVPVCHKFEYSKWESGDSPRFNRSIAYNGEPYGTGIHISGENNRIAALRETWLKDVAAFAPNVEYKLFYGAPHDRAPEPDEVFLGCGDTYADLPAKTICICRYAKENGYDFVFKADDDSFVCVDRLINELLLGRFDYAGYLHGRVCSGGPGYWLSRRAFTVIADHANAGTHWAEDVMVSTTLFHHDIQPVMLETHRPGFSDHWFFPGAVDLSKLTGDEVVLHAVQPDRMREIYAIRTAKPKAA